jgi:peptide deformylase
MPLEILKYPHPTLKKVAEPVKHEEITDELRATFAEMADLMNDARGVGLAAVQVGILKRFFIMISDLESDEPKVVVAINPEIVEKSGEINDEEGCLSFPDVSANVKRAEKVKMKALNENGEEFEMEQEGYMARCIQHEIDHLNGITYFDHLSPLKRKMIEKKYKKLMNSNGGI